MGGRRAAGQPVVCFRRYRCSGNHIAGLAAAATEDLRPIERAIQLVLEGDSSGGRAILKDQLQQDPGDQSVRMLLVDLLLNELRRDQTTRNS
ncbi:MAG UNVERIFIED_CONTAM: hypothetical protein LVR18_02815 [Planctomycetaceae bacterium]